MPLDRLRIQQEGLESWAAYIIEMNRGEYSGSHLELGVFPSYDKALEALIASAQYGTIIAAASADQGLLPEAWTSVQGIAFSEATGDGRDFSACTWSSRDPSVSLLPLMLQTETEVGHYGAELAGFIESLSGLGYRGTPDATGRFYATDCGVQCRDMLQGGRMFGCSVDPGPATEATFRCTEKDPEGDFCIDGIYEFSAYEIIGLTCTPFPGFAQAAIRLVAEGDMAAGVAVGIAASLPAVTEAVRSVVASSAPTRPPRAWFEAPEPDLGDERLIPQEGGALAMPFQISDEGWFMGHLTYDGQCHVGYQNTCVSAPGSMTGYAHFHVGDLVTDEGDHLAVGALFAGTDHADISYGPAATVDHYAHTGMAWGDARVTDGQFGVWACGALRPDLTDAQLRVIRASTMSGDWRRIGGHLELVAALSVNSGGFPIVREALAASGLAMADEGMVRARIVGGEQVALVAASVVQRCPECARRAQMALAAGNAGGHDIEVLQRLEAQGRLLATLERRTRHLAPEAAQYSLKVSAKNMPDEAVLEALIARALP